MQYVTDSTDSVETETSGTADNRPDDVIGRLTQNNRNMQRVALAVNRRRTMRLTFLSPFAAVTTYSKFLFLVSLLTSHFSTMFLSRGLEEVELLWYAALDI